MLRPNTFSTSILKVSQLYIKFWFNCCHPSGPSNNGPNTLTWAPVNTIGSMMSEKDGSSYLIALCFLPKSLSGPAVSLVLPLCTVELPVLIML